MTPKIKTGDVLKALIASQEHSNIIKKRFDLDEIKI